MMSLTWAYGVTTVTERFRTTLPPTLSSLASAGFPEPRLFVDGVHLPDEATRDAYWISQRVPRIGLAANWSLSVVELYLRDPDADRYALFQDDLSAVHNLREYLEACPYPANGYLNLFTFLDNEGLAGKHRPLGWAEGATMEGSRGQVYHGKKQQVGRGALALVFSREALTTLFMQPHFVTRPQGGADARVKIDGGIVEAMNKAGWREWIHNPSLVTHRGTLSTKAGVRWTKNSKTFPGEQFDAMSLLK